MIEIQTSVTPSGVAVVQPKGRVDATSASAVREHLHALVKSGTSRVVVDLSAVETIDSTGLGALISGLKATRKNGGDLRIVNPNELIISMLELTSLDWVLRTFESVDSAFP